MNRILLLLSLSLLISISSCVSDNKGPDGDPNAEEQFDKILKGAISFRTGTDVPPSSVMIVRLLDITNEQHMVVRELKKEIKKENLPYPYEIGYNDDDIQEGKKYGLDAKITFTDITIYHSTKPIEVLSNSLKNNVTLMLKEGSPK